MVKTPMGIAGQNYPSYQYLGKFLSVCTSSDSSVNQSGSPSVTLSPPSKNPSKFPGSHGEKNMVNSMHKILLKSPSINTLSVKSVGLPIPASSIPSIHQMMNIRKSRTNSPVVAMGGNSCLKLWQKS